MFAKDNHHSEVVTDTELQATRRVILKKALHACIDENYVTIGSSKLDGFACYELRNTLGQAGLADQTELIQAILRQCTLPELPKDEAKKRIDRCINKI
jgi:hypothetical protein